MWYFAVVFKQQLSNNDISLENHCSIIINALLRTADICYLMLKLEFKGLLPLTLSYSTSLFIHHVHFMILHFHCSS